METLKDILEIADMELMWAESESQEDADYAAWFAIMRELLAAYRVAVWCALNPRFC